MRTLITLLALLLFMPVAYAEGAADLFRSITGSLKGVRQAPQEKPATATMGVRGMDDEGGNKSGAPASTKDNILMEGWAATKPAASHAAEKKGLVARQVTIKN